MSRKRTRSVDAMLADVEISDGRVSMTAGARDGASVYVRVPEQTPLTQDEQHAELRLTGPEFEATLSLDADGVYALVDALEGGDDE